MPRRPEIGNVQLYPNRPLRGSDRNGYVLKFYCPIQCKRIRRNCGTRDRREARKILRECRQRLVNGKYVESEGAISEQHGSGRRKIIPTAQRMDSTEGPSWEECLQVYFEHRKIRVRSRSLDDAKSRLGIAEKILTGWVDDVCSEDGLMMQNVACLDALEYLQSRLLDGDECRHSERSPSTVNSMMGAVMAFVRFCYVRKWIDGVPPVEKLEIDEAMKGRPISEIEFQQMLEAVPKVVGESSKASWELVLRVLWGTGFRVGDLMSFSWDDSRQIHPVWGRRDGEFATIIIPSSQKNGKVQEIPMLPELQDVLQSVPPEERNGWVVNPASIEFDFCGQEDSFRPDTDDLEGLAETYSNSAIARCCGVSEAAVRKWLKQLDLPTQRSGCESVVPAELADGIRVRAARQAGSPCINETERMTKERVSRVISKIGRQAGVVVQLEDERLGKRKKYASAHDIRRGVARRLIDSGVSAETLKVVMRHKDFATTERHYGAVRSAQSAAKEIAAKTTSNPDSSELVGGLMGGTKKAPQLSAEELCVLKSLLAKL